jgi:hypothetical protein
MVLSSPLVAQTLPPRVFLEGRGGAAVPTFAISDAIDAGSDFGVTAGLHLSPRWILMGAVDIGSHEGAVTGSADIATNHYIAKVGYSLTGQRIRGWEVSLNLGVGAMSFDPEGTGERFTYPAINAGAKVVYNISRALGVVLSPQGDIAFSDEEEVTTSTAWVWPLTAGLRIRF